MRVYEMKYDRAEFDGVQKNNEQMARVDRLYIIEETRTNMRTTGVACSQSTGNSPLFEAVQG